MTEGARLSKAGMALAAFLALTAAQAAAGSDRVAQFTKFALDRCILPVVSGAGANVTGLQQKDRVQKAASAEALALQESRRVYTETARGFLLLVPEEGGCTALALSVPSQEVRAAVAAWARDDMRLTALAEASGDGSTSEYLWRLRGRAVHMLLRTDAPKARAAIVMTEGE